MKRKFRFFEKNIDQKQKFQKRTSTQIYKTIFLNTAYLDRAEYFSQSYEAIFELFYDLKGKIFFGSCTIIG